MREMQERHTLYRRAASGVKTCTEVDTKEVGHKKFKTQNLNRKGKMKRRCPRKLRPPKGEGQVESEVVLQRTYKIQGALDGLGPVAF